MVCAIVVKGGEMEGQRDCLDADCWSLGRRCKRALGLRPIAKLRADSVWGRGFEASRRSDVSEKQWTPPTD